jgi:hypothetical protein
MSFNPGRLLAGIIPLMAGVSGQEEKGFLQLKDTVDEAEVVLGNWYDKTERLKTLGSQPVPAAAGSYSMADIRLFRQDGEGEVWSTRCILPEGISIQAGQTTSIPGIGGPEKARVIARKIGPSYYSFSFLIEDSQKNRYSYFRKNGNSLGDPGFVLQDGEGRQLASGRFYPG